LACRVCGATTNQRGDPLLTQAALNGHMGAHRGNGSERKQPQEVHDAA
jgi:predicted aconitase